MATMCHTRRWDYQIHTAPSLPVYSLENLGRLLVSTKWYTLPRIGGKCVMVAREPIPESAARGRPLRGGTAVAVVVPRREHTAHRQRRDSDEIRQ